jgi:hypothetical protein
VNIWPFSNSSFEKQIIKIVSSIYDKVLDGNITTTLLTNEVRKMSQATDNLNAQVLTLTAAVDANGKAVVDVATIIKGLTQQLADALTADDHVAVQAASDAIAAQATNLTAQTAVLNDAKPVTPEAPVVPDANPAITTA